MRNFTTNNSWKGDVFIKTDIYNKENLKYEKLVYKKLYEENKKHPEIDDMFILPIAILTKSNKNILITKKYNTIQLENYIYDNKLTIEELYNILVELFNVVYYMNEILNIYHNDLHFKNVFIEIHEPKIKKYFFNPSYPFLCKYMSKYTIRVYDFDNAFIFDQKNNYLITKDMCIDYGSCNFKSTKDLFVIATICINYYGKNPN